MYSINEIQHVHLELSSRCNAACPLCPRNFHGYPYNDGYIEHDMTLAEAQHIFSVDLIKQLNVIIINGNFGDAVMNSDTIPIVEYFRSCNPDLNITISTNAGARNKKFWQSLAQLNVQVLFCIDGLEDTHHLYRQNTNYKTVIKNSQTFIKAGGRAIWKMIKFKHNQHQYDAAEQLSKELGFTNFQLVDHGRDQSPVYNKTQQLTHVIGNPVETEFRVLFQKRKEDEVLLEDIVNSRTPKKISCQVKKKKSIYISSTGDVFPCCFLGFSPKTYGHGNYYSAANAQFRDAVQKNNALEYSLQQCIDWFSYVEKSWSTPTFEQGRLVICNDVCGAD
jgi:MoaA/NifB/PqqE/SkfB family radical SAM enzyme